jgi:esterase/lipase
MFRTRFKKEIVAEFLPPLRAKKKQKLIILCDGMPSIPRKQPLAEFLAAPNEIFVIGGSFGGAAAILLSLDPRIKRVVANCPVTNWGILDRSEKAETSKENYAEYIREAFGNSYRLSDANWQKLRSGSFYNPWHRRKEINPSKILIFHAKDDPYVPYEGSRRFADATGVTLKSLRQGGHISTDYITRKYWAQIKKFFDSKRV